jgi:hypothetical protein
MSATGKNKGNSPTARLLTRLLVAALCLVLLIALAIKIFLSSAIPASQLSRFMTSYLHQSFTVQSLHTSGGALLLKGVRLQNPAGFPQQSLAAADSVVVAPQWGNLLLGRQSFRLIALEGIRINLDKNSQGVWNYAHLQQLLAGRKPSAAETYIKELIVKDGALKVQGQGVQGIALQVFNLTTKGSRDSKVDLGFEDAAHNRYALKGKVRAGADAALDLTLTAPALSLKDLALFLKLKNPGPFEGGKGALQVNGSFRPGVLSTTGDFSFRDLRLPSAGKTLPVAGLLHFAADYSVKSDTVRLLSCTLAIKDLVRLHAAGSARNLKGERDYALDIVMEEVALGTLDILLSQEVRRNLLFSGRLRCDALHLEGSGVKGLKNATGTLQLHDGALTRKGSLMVAGLSGTIGFSRRDADILAKGRLSLSGPHDKALLEALDATFRLTLSSRLKPLWAEVSGLSARVMGIPVKGRLAFEAAKATPVTASLKVPVVSLSALNSLLGRYDLHAASGTATATLEIAGKSAQELTASANLQLSDLRGSRGKNSIAVKTGSLAAKGQRKGGHLLAQGHAQLTALALDGKTGDAAFGYRVVDKIVYLDDALARVGDTQLSISHLSGSIPARASGPKLTSYPITLDLDGCVVKQRKIEVSRLSGRLRGSFNTDSAGRWLEGTADLASGAVSWQGRGVAAPVLHASFSRSGGKGELAGQLLGGKLAGTASFNPFAPEAGGNFELGLSGAAVAEAAQFVPKRAGVTPTAGVADLRLKGSYSRRDGLACRFESKGSGLALAGRGGKALVSGAGLTLSGALAGGNLSISEAVLSPGPGVALKLKGELAQAFSPQRKGSLAFSLPEAALTAMVDPFVNILPRFIQEASVDGSVAADGKIELHDGRELVEGSLAFKGGRMEIPSQKLVVADVNGRLPFSLDLSGKAVTMPQIATDFSKENYPLILEQLRRKAGAGQVVTVGKIAFGALELGKLTMYITAANGSTEITSLSTSLYEGALLGRGFFTMRNKLTFREDLLVNNVSMKKLCSLFPGIKGYISGRVDGVISINGVGKEVAGMTGFIDLWAREGGGEKMVVSKEFLQRLSKQKLAGFFFSSDRAYDQAEIKAMLEQGDLSFDTLKIVHTNLFGVRDLSVAIAPSQNRIALDHLLDSIREAAVRGKPKAGEKPAEAPATPEFKWGE